MSRRWLGIDFSGNHRMWKPDVSASNVWIADVQAEDNKPTLKDLCTVQELEGEEIPFERLKALLGKRVFSAAAIDAPFSIPLRYMPRGGHRELINRTGKAERKGRPFPTAHDFVSKVVKVLLPDKKKPCRETERYWRSQGVNVRSTLWEQPRGGAAMTSACLTLLYDVSAPMWPWEASTKGGLLVEAFPAAQLRHWNLPHQGYADNSHAATAKRQEIMGRLGKLIRLSSHRKKMEKSADALDAVICSLAAIAVTTNSWLEPQGNWPREEGLIAVYRNDPRSSDG